MYELLFVNGDKGLVATLNGRFMFPDRKSNIKTEGIYDCTITVDKDKYAFVTGTPVETKAPSDDFIRRSIEKKLFSTDFFTNTEKLNVKKIGQSIVIFRRLDRTVQIGYIDSEDIYRHLLAYEINNPYEHNIARLYNAHKFAHIDDFNHVKETILSELATELNNDLLIKAATTAFIQFMSYAYRKPDKVTVSDNKFITVTSHYYGIESCQTYIHVENKGVVKLDESMIDCLSTTNNVKNIDINKLISYASDNYLGARFFGDEETYSTKISFMSNDITVTCLNGRIFIDDISDESKDKAKKSFDELAAYRKRVGKQLSKSSLMELTKLSPRQILKLNGGEY